MFRRKHEINVDSELSQELVPKSGTLSQELAIPKTGTLPVVGSKFCTPDNTLVLTVQKTRNKTCSGGDLVVNDPDGHLFLRVDGRACSFRDNRVLRNASGKPIITLRRKILSINNQWEAFRGEKTESANLLFRARTSCPLQLKTSVNVYMADNTEEEQWNFKVKGDYIERSAIFYYGARIIAELSRKRASNCNALLGRDTFLITIHPGVDYAFIVALVAVLDEIHRDPFRE
eukprot:Gb_03485 [translate_table: standard]